MKNTTQVKQMTKKRAIDIISENALNNARVWLERVAENGRVFYTVESKSGNTRKISLAAAYIYKGKPDLLFFWPNPSGGHPENDEALKAVGGYSAAMDVAAKAVGFALKKRCFDVQGGGMDMVFSTLYDLAWRVVDTMPENERKAFIERTSAVDRKSLNRID